MYMHLFKLLLTNILTKPKYVNQLQNMRIILNTESFGYFLEASIPQTPTDTASEEEKEKATNKKWVEDNLQVKSFILLL